MRSTAIRAVAKANKLDLEIVYTKPPNELPESYHTINPLGRIPTFVGADGYELTECIAIAIYSMRPNIFAFTFFLFRSMMRKIIIYSYPCLKTTVENHSHSDQLPLQPCFRRIA